MDLDRLWTPWRAEYVTGGGDDDELRDGAGGCFLCDGPQRGDDAAALILARTPLAYLVLNKYPYNTGHVMAAPFEHGGDLGGLAAEAGQQVWDLVREAVRALRDEYRPDGFNVGMNVGAAAGAGVPDHLHVHVVPRWVGDTNYITVVSGTKVLPETLERTYARLAARFRGDGGKESGD